MRAAWHWTALVVVLITAPLGVEERIERFDRDPDWDGHNHRAKVPEPRTVVQDFGYSSSTHAGSKLGEMGGFISATAEPAYYAKQIATN
jgi:hypothetical protein